MPRRVLRLGVAIVRVLGPPVGALRGRASRRVPGWAQSRRYRRRTAAPGDARRADRQLVADGCRDVADVYERAVLPIRLPLQPPPSPPTPPPPPPPAPSP